MTFCLALRLGEDQDAGMGDRRAAPGTVHEDESGSAPRGSCRAGIRTKAPSPKNAVLSAVKRLAREEVATFARCGSTVPARRRGPDGDWRRSPRPDAARESSAEYAAVDEDEPGARLLESGPASRAAGRGGFRGLERRPRDRREVRVPPRLVLRRRETRAFAKRADGVPPQRRASRRLSRETLSVERRRGAAV